MNSGQNVTSQTLPPNSGHLSITDKYFETRRCPLFRGFTVLILLLLLLSSSLLLLLFSILYSTPLRKKKKDRTLLQNKAQYLRIFLIGSILFCLLAGGLSFYGPENWPFIRQTMREFLLLFTINFFLWPLA